LTITWLSPTVTDNDVVNLGPLALIHPLLQRLNVAGVIDQHLPPDPQLEFSHGKVLSLLLAARLSEPTALVNVSAWAKKTGAELLFGIPADKLNDDRLGRSLDAFFEQRHSILGHVSAHVLKWAEMSLARLHFDPTHLIFTGKYTDSVARPDPNAKPIEPICGDASLPHAHIAHGYHSDDKMVQVGVTAAIDDLGAIPVLCHVLDGNRNGFTAIREQVDLLHEHLCLPKQLTMISDRGTFSVDRAARMHRNGHAVLCAVQWKDYRDLYDANESSLLWQDASFLSREQRRRRDSGSSLPQEHYEIAVLKHTLIDPTNKEEIPARVIFAYSSANAAECRQRREQNVAKIRSGLEALVVKVERAHPCTTLASVQRQIAKLLGERDAARYFTWNMIPLSVAEMAALPPPRKGFRRQTHRLNFTCNETAAAAEDRYDGLSVLVTTAPATTSGDALFTQYKEQNYLESLHHQWKTPLAVRPIFLKSPERVEALVCLMYVALQVHQLLERLYRQRVPSVAPASERRCTAESLLREFAVCGIVVGPAEGGRVVNATRLTARQRDILGRLGLPTPFQTLARILPPLPTQTLPRLLTG
jgi:transposase